MNRLKLAALIVAMVSLAAWIVSICRADEPQLLYYPVQPTITPQPLKLTGPKLREVVVLVPNFRCGACEWWASNVLPQVKGIRVTKRVDMTLDGWPQLLLPDCGHVWRYEHPVTRQPLTAKQIELILKEYPPKSTRQ